MKVQEKKSQKHHIRWMLVCFDVLIYLISAILLLVLYGGMDRLTTASIAEQMRSWLPSVEMNLLMENMYAVGRQIRSCGNAKNHSVI